MLSLTAAALGRSGRVYPVNHPPMGRGWRVTGEGRGEAEAWSPLRRRTGEGGAGGRRRGGRGWWRRVELSGSLRCNVALGVLLGRKQRKCAAPLLYCVYSIYRARAWAWLLASTLTDGRAGYARPMMRSVEQCSRRSWWKRGGANWKKRVVGIWKWEEKVYFDRKSSKVSSNNWLKLFGSASRGMCATTLADDCRRDMVSETVGLA